MPIATREQIIIAADNDLTAVLLTKHRDKLLPPIATDTRHHLIALFNTFHKLLPHDNATLPPPLSLPPATLTIAPTTPLPRVVPPALPRVVPSGVPRVHIPLRFVTSPRTTSPVPSTVPLSPPYAPDPSIIDHINNLIRDTKIAAPTQCHIKARGLYLRTSSKKAMPRETATSTTNPIIHAINAVLNADTDKMKECRHLIKGPQAHKWQAANTKEIARPVQGRADGSVEGTNTLFFKHPHAIPKAKKATYLRVVAAYRPTKEDPHRIRWTVGGNNIVYPSVTYTPNADLVTTKLLFNSVISTKNAKFLGIDLKDFYLNTPMNRYKYTFIPVTMIPPEIMEEYKLKDLVHNGMVLSEIRKGMYGLSQAGRLAYNKLVAHLAEGGYVPTPHTPGLFCHKTRAVTFCLIVDDFGIKYIHKHDVYHLIDHLSKNYKATVDWEEKFFCGLHLKWDCNSSIRSVELDIPLYVKLAIVRFLHILRKYVQHPPHPFTHPTYGAEQQRADPISHIPLKPTDKEWMEQIVGVLLYYARAIDSTMLLPIGSISSARSTDTIENLIKRIHHFLDYAATHPNTKLKYFASAMHLWVESDASYLY